MTQPDPGPIPPAMPLPVQALPYSVPAYYSRPGLITAIGVMCVVVACLSGIGSMMSAMYGFGFWMMSRVTAAMATATTTSTSMSMSVGSRSGPTTSQSLPPGDASAAVNELTKMLSLDAPRVRELDKLLRLHGREILGGEEDTPVSAAAVRAGVTGHGMGPAAGAVYFTTAQGRVEIYRNRATFVASDGSTTINTSARNNSDSMQQTTSATVGAAPAGSTTLTPAQVNQVLSAVKGLAVTPLNAKQAASLQAELSKPNQQLVTPADATPASYVNNQNGNVTIGFDTGNLLVLGPQGNVVRAGPIMPRVSISASAAAIVIGEGATSVLVAIYLLIAGILVFRSYPKSPRLLRIYAVIKIPLALLAGSGVGLMGYQFATSIATSTGVTATAPAAFGFIVWGIVIAVLGCAFPVGLLIALRTRTARDYFNSAVG